MLVMEVRMLNQVMGSYTMDQLQMLIAGQAALPGRKTVLYLSEGLSVPADMPERLRSIISSANRANVTFYTADCSGLTTVNSAQVANGVAAAIDRASIGDPSLRFNGQQNMAELAEGTGGYAMLNSNDLRSPLQRVMEEVRAHYEIAYRPTSEKYDGHFRTTVVKVNRPGVKVQSRRGYYALPSLKGQDLLLFETAGMNALSQSPLPRAFAVRTAAFQFRGTPQSTEVLVAFEVPTRELKAETVTAFLTFKSHPSFVAIILQPVDPGKKPGEPIPCFVTIPMEKLSPGNYEFTVTMQQGGKAITHATVVTLR